MKHLTKIAAMMVAATIFALPLGAQHRGGHSSGHSGASSSYSGGSRSSGSSHSGVSRSSGSYSSGSHRSGSSYSRSSDSGRSSSSSRSSGSVSTRSSSERSSGSVRDHSSASRSSGSVRQHSSSSRSSSSSATRSSGSVREHSSSAREHSGALVRDNSRSGSVRQHSDGARAHSGTVRPNNGGGNRPSGGSHSSGNVRPNRYHDGVYASNRPAPGSRPYASGGAYHGRPAPSAHVRVNPRPGHHGRPAFVARELRHAPAHFSHVGHHHYGHYRTALPPRYVVRHYWGRDYYYYNDIWYRYYGGRYWVCRPPFGYVFTPLADAIYTACSFAYYFDRLHYYDTVNENANTIIAQNETIAANNAVIASQNETIARNAELAQASGDLANSLGLVQSFASADTEYFYNDGVFYVKGADGQYTVIVPPAGALVDTLPEDYELIDLGGNTYYKVDDTVYRATVSPEGKACFEVLGQLTK